MSKLARQPTNFLSSSKKCSNIFSQRLKSNRLTFAYPFKTHFLCHVSSFSTLKMFFTEGIAGNSIIGEKNRQPRSIHFHKLTCSIKKERSIIFGGLLERDNVDFWRQLHSSYLQSSRVVIARYFLHSTRRCPLNGLEICAYSLRRYCFYYKYGPSSMGTCTLGFSSHRGASCPLCRLSCILYSNIVR